MNNKICVSPSGIEFTDCDDKTVLHSALEKNIYLEHSCGTGQCGACKAKLVTGQIDFEDKYNILTESEKSEGIFLTCTSKALSDIQMEAEYLPELAGIQKKTVPGKIDSVDFPVPDVAVLRLRLPPTANFNYLPGQYIDLMYNGIARSYSIASAPAEKNMLELHIRKVENGKFSHFVFNEFKPNQLLRMQGPVGTFFVRDNEKPLIFLAGGTGFAPVKAMVESLIKQDDKRTIHIYWGVRTRHDIYSNLPEQWELKYPHIKSHVVISNDEQWKGRSGFVHQAVLNDFDKLDEFMVYACGAPAMINIARQTFIEKGLDEHSFIADAFLPATVIA